MNHELAGRSYQAHGYAAMPVPAWRCVGVRGDTDTGWCVAWQHHRDQAYDYLADNGRVYTEGEAEARANTLNAVGPQQPAAE